jgi:prepilin signal peptidase PulO-like enzyme (type II secretory pathway)
MDILLSIFAFLFGAIVGSFLNVVIYRLHTGKSINGRSHCLSCGTELQWFELVPILSYLFLRARCRHCSAHIPVRYAAVEVATGLTFLLLWNLFGGSPLLLLFYAIFASVLIIIFVYDIRHTIIPDELVILLSVLALIYVLFGHGLQTFVPALMGGMFCSLFFGGLWYFSKGRWMGLGDAKLAFPLGFMVGFPAAYSMLVLSFVVGALVSLILLALQRLLKTGKTVLRYSGIPLTIKSEVPFAPFLIVGFVLTQLFHADIFNITLAFLLHL